MESVCVILLLMFGSSIAVPQDLRRRMFTFPLETNSDRVIVKLNQTELGALTVCMRVFSDLTRCHSLFLLTTDSIYNPRNNFLIMNHPVKNQYTFQYKNHQASFNLKNEYVINKWQTVCGTWDGDKGVAQLWIDGKRSSRKFLGKDRMKGPMSVILGQGHDPARDRGQFGQNWTDTSFTGMVTNICIWNFVLPPFELMNYPDDFFGFPANGILYWRSVDFEIHGAILLEEFF